MLKRTRSWPLLFCVPLLVSLRVHLVTVTNDFYTQNAFIDDDGWLVLVVGRTVSAGGYPSLTKFTGEHVDRIRPYSAQSVSMMPVRVVLGLVALGALIVHVGDRRKKGTTVVIDRHGRIVGVSTPRESRKVAFHDQPHLVLRDDDVYLHTGKARPILLAREHECLPSQVERLQRALTTVG